MDHDVYVGGVGVEGLADHQAGLAMGVFALAHEGNVGGGGGEVASDFAVNEVEGVQFVPDVFAGGADAVLVSGLVVLGGAGGRDFADVSGGFEVAYLGGGGG